MHGKEANNASSIKWNSQNSKQQKNYKNKLKNFQSTIHVFLLKIVIHKGVWKSIPEK